MNALEKTNISYCDETIALKERIEYSFLELGERLANIRENEMFKPKYESFSEFLEELRIADGTASKLISIYHKFVVEMKLPKEKLLALGGWSDLSEMVPFVQTKTQAIEMIDTLSPMRRVDRRAFLTAKKTGIAFHECKHPKDERYTITLCKLCKQKI